MALVVVLVITEHAVPEFTVPERVSVAVSEANRDTSVHTPVPGLYVPLLAECPV